MYLILWMLFVWALSFIGNGLGIIPEDSPGDLDFIERRE